MSPPDEGLHALAIPTPFAVGRVNCYLVDDDPLTLVDTGPNSGTSLMALEAALGAHGKKVEDLERIVLTHQHIDHIGLARIVAERSGAEICALDALAPWLARCSAAMDGDHRFAEDVMRRHGIPGNVVYALRAVMTQVRAWGASAEVTHPLRDGETLAFAHRTWTVHHRPGHSPSDTVFHDEPRGLLVGGDHLIKHISSNALIARPLDGSTAERPKALVSYLASLAATREMPLRAVLTGHGDPIGGHAELITERVRQHERRKRRIHGLLEPEPLTAYEIARALWGNVAVTQAYLTLSEVLGHLDLLSADGAVSEVESNGVVRFAAA